MNRKKLIIPVIMLGIICGIVVIKCNAQKIDKAENVAPVASAAPTEPTATWQLGKTLTEAEVSKAGVDHFFSITEISDAIFARMQKGGSYPAHCTVKRSDLRYVQLLHYNFKGEIVCGEMVCNKSIASDVKEAFKELFNAKYQIEHVRLIDDYGANDEKSMTANNTSSFCYRVVAGSKKLSKHAQGLAIDINPLYNPMVKRNNNGSIVKIQPDNDTARQYATRNTKLAHIINKDDMCYKVFIKHGFTWGGAWRHSKDYQHFEK